MINKLEMHGENVVVAVVRCIYVMCAWLSTRSARENPSTHPPSDLSCNTVFRMQNYE